MGDMQEIPASLIGHPAVWREPAALTLDEEGVICDCSDSGEELFGYSRRELIRQHVSKLLPQLSEVKLVQDGHLNQRFGLLCRCGQHFQAQGRYGSSFQSELSFVHLDHSGKCILRLFVRPADNVEA